MGYTIPELDEAELVDQEFDHVDWQIREGHGDAVREICSRTLGASDLLPRRRSLTHLLMATLDLISQRYEEALWHFGAVRAVPAALESRVTAGVAKALTMLGRMEEAHRVIKQFVSVSPESWRAWEALGVWQRAQGDRDGAWQSLLRASECNPREASIISSLIEVGDKPVQSADLAVVLERHLAAEPFNLVFRVCLVSCFINLGDVPRARNEARRIVAFGPYADLSVDVLGTMRQLLVQLERM